MILFDKLWQTMQERGITQYDLYTKYNMNRAQLHRLRHNQTQSEYRNQYSRSFMQYIRLQH